MQKAGGSNDMIALVWFVSRFFVTKAFGRASPPAFSFGFPCFHIHFKNKLNRNGLLVHCGILTSTVWYIFFFFFWVMESYFCVCILRRFGVCGRPVQIPLVSCGREKWMSNTVWTPGGSGRRLWVNRRQLPVRTSGWKTERSWAELRWRIDCVFVWILFTRGSFEKGSFLWRKDSVTQ